ncbi:MAG: helix-turn-helix domain-containing protein [Ignavibacteriales bacterium]
MNMLSSESRGARIGSLVWSALPETGAADVRRLNRATAFIEQNLASRDLTPEAVASAANVSRSTLYRLFKSRGGVRHYILQRRLSMASERLGDPAEFRQVGELAFDLGFVSEAHFSRAFRQAFGAPPGAFRWALGEERRTSA